MSAYVLGADEPDMSEVLSLAIDSTFRLAPLKPEDAEAWYAAVAENRTDLSRWVRSTPAVQNVEEARRLIASRQHRTSNQEEVYVGLWQHGLLAGSISVRIDWREHLAEFGYWLGVAHQGQGLMTQACRAVIEVLFAHGVHRIQIRCATENLASRKIPERLGFALEGILRHTQRLNGCYVDHAIYGLLANAEHQAP